MIFRMNPASQISFTNAASASSPLIIIPNHHHPLGRRHIGSSSAAIRAKFFTPSKLVVVEHLSSRKAQQQLSWASSSTISVGFIEKRIAGTSYYPSRKLLSIRTSAMPSTPVPVGSASFYPIKGFYFFLRPENRAVLKDRITKFAVEVGAASLAVFGSLVGFTFRSQRDFLLQGIPPLLGTPCTLALISIETALPLTVIFQSRMHRVQEKLFVDVMRIQGVQVEKASADEREWIDEQREIQRQQTQAQEPSIVRTILDPEALNASPWLKYIVTLPLNFVPVAGQAAFCWLNAMGSATVLHHYYYSKLKGLSKQEEAAVIHFRKDEYQQFGLAATALSLVPGIDILFVLTNAVGAALWAADIEKAMQKRR